MSVLIERFREEVSKVGKPSLGTDLEEALWVLAFAEDKFDNQALAANEVAQIMLKVLRSNTSWQRVGSLLDAQPTLAIKTKTRGRQPSTYTITDLGRKRLSDASTDALLVQPQTGFSGVRRVESMFAELSGTVRICDPYLAPRSMDFLVQMSKAESLVVLTKNITDKDKVKSDLQLLRSELGVDIEIRVAQGRDLHDRYVIDERSMIVLGTSLNGLGKRQTIVVEVGEDLRAITLSAFEGLFEAANPI